MLLKSPLYSLDLKQSKCSLSSEEGDASQNPLCPLLTSSKEMQAIKQRGGYYIKSPLSSLDLKQ